MLLDQPSVLDAWAFPDATAAQLAQWDPQAALIPVLDALTPAALSADGQIDALLALQRHLGVLHAREAELLAALDAGDDTEDGWARDWVAAALRVPPASMTNRMTMARDLTERLPATLALLRAGGITQRHATDLVDATRTLPPDKAAAVEARVLGRAGEQTPAQFRASVKRAVLSVSDPVDEQNAHRDAVAQRRVVITPTEHGMSELWALLPADGAATIKATLDAIAHATLHQPGGDPRSGDQRRADALIDLARAALTQYGPTGATTAGPAGTTPNTGDQNKCDPNPGDPNPDDPNPGDPNPDDPNPGSANPADRDPTDGTDSAGGSANPDTDPTCGSVADLSPWALALAAGHGQRPAIQVTIAASTLMGLDNQPAELDGYGPITAAMARRIAADPTATWRRLLTDDNGLVRHAGVRTYRPPPDMARTVIARDQHCTYPGCRTPAKYDDLDHVKAYEDGDDTTAANLMALCRRHHRLKHSGLWHVERDDDTGTTTWTDNKARSYRSRPPTLPTTTTATMLGPTDVPKRSFDAAIANLDPPPF